MKKNSSTPSTQKKRKSVVIWIGGVPYRRKAKYKGWQCYIIGYDINTERHLLIRNTWGEEERIELDNDRLILTEAKYTKEIYK